MMRKKITWGILLIVLLTGGFLAWQFFGPTVSAPEGNYFYIPTGSTYAGVKESLLDKKIISSPFFFDLISKQVSYNKSVKAGRYLVKDGMGLFRLIRMLRAGNQAPVNLVITKLRTKEDLAQKLAANFEPDSAAFANAMNNPSLLKNWHLDSNTLMTLVIPNTYSFLWNSSPEKIFNKLEKEKEKFWNEERRNKAKTLKLSPEQVYTVASIVEEETNKQEDKGKIASVYLNRLEKGIRLQADPTVKFALKNFEIKRVREKHIAVSSPFNTYQNSGLPPGPICTPSSKTIDAVLNAPVTNYIFFVAKPDWSGLSNFSESYEEHQINAKNYQRFLDSVNIK